MYTMATIYHVIFQFYIQYHKDETKHLVFLIFLSFSYYKNIKFESDKKTFIYLCCILNFKF